MLKSQDKTFFFFFCSVTGNTEPSKTTEWQIKMLRWCKGQQRRLSAVKSEVRLIRPKKRRPLLHSASQRIHQPVSVF